MSFSNGTSGDIVASFSDTTATPVQRFVPRASHACQTCRLKKTRCDQQTPCSFCQKHSINCVYSLNRNSQSLSSHSHGSSRTGPRASKQKRNAAPSVFRHSSLSSTLRGQQIDNENGYDAMAIESRSPALQPSIGPLSKDPENRPPVDDRESKRSSFLESSPVNSV
jgi:hypothetical protein